MRALAVGMLGGLPLLVGLCFVVPEAPARIGQPPSLWRGAVLVVRNPAFLRVVVSTVLFVSGVAMQGTLHRMVLTDVMGEPDRFLWMILLENVASLLLVPVWLALAVRVEKHQALIGASCWLALFSLPLLFLREGHALWMMAVIAVRGSSFASVLFLSASLAADVIDVDTAASGSERSGLFFAVWGMATKLSLAVGVLLGTGLPALWGYTPGQPATGEVAAGVMAAYGLVPAALMGLGSLALRGFPLTRARHAALQRSLQS
jgi:Na+/melibiose symporter-like transporter